MLHVSLFIEILRLRPRLFFWLVTLTQAAVWTIVPALFYSAPPGNVAEVLVIGRNAALNSEVGPPLAYWLADLAFRAAGNSVVGVYVLAQFCVVATYWAVFTLGRDLVGDRQAVLAILLMAGISALSAATPDFGPALLAMPLWALSVLAFWRAVRTEQSWMWFVLTALLGVLMITSYLGLILTALLALFTAVNPHARARLISPHGAGAAFFIMSLALVPLALLGESRGELLSRLTALRSAEMIHQNLTGWLRLGATVLLSHVGFVIIAVLAARAISYRRPNAPAIEGKVVDDTSRALIFYVALAPAVAVTVGAAIVGYAGTLNPAPLVVFSGLALIVAAGPRISLHNQHLLGWAWTGLLLVPPVVIAIFVSAAPVLFGTELKVAQPASAVGRFFAENFERRTGRPLAIVAGDRNLALMVAAGAPSRPAAIVEEPGFPKVTAKDIADKGMIVVWPVTDTAGTPPPAIKERFPDLAPEVPRAFERPVQGWQPLLRIGWGMIRPAAASTPANPPAQ
jgi:4-amino-4-deoxy-L-arabinose transferase-like glycosyltransferase